MPLLTNKPAWIAIGLLLLATGAVVTARLFHEEGGDRAQRSDELPVPVEVAVVQQGPLSLRRTFSGTIEPKAQFKVATKVGGQIQRLQVDVSDPVSRGQTVAYLEDAEFRQIVVEADARLAVAEANRVEANSRLEIAQRELERTKALHVRGIASDSDLDSAGAEFLASQAAVKVSEANLKREQAVLTGAEIRLGYTRVEADWEQGDDGRVVAERYANEGNTVAANTALFSIIELDPVLAVIQVTEKDYPRLVIGQQASLLMDAFPGHVFPGTVSRIAPIFRASSRQARVELNVPNPEHLLKPGMFARCIIELERVEKTASVPELAIIHRGNKTGVFLVNDDGTSVKWVEVEPGIRDGSQVELVGAQISGRVVTIGQQFIKDDSAIRVSENEPDPPRTPGAP
ncbi:MAG: efflux RND transporter periplasmic adaptor subunit [Gammaproteobacteria bacterium]|nr:efflux RND transporter periplasmic adaptor subunit [Gammaproteobacteria bacterium]MDH3466466.1 efflux RND transporter periplasmic adaptor subunit [Gammaproteobacteria bacterium]